MAINRRGLKTAFGALLIGSAVVFGAWLYDFSNSFRFEGPVPRGVEAIPAEAFSRKPLIDASFVGTRFEYPRTEEKPKFPMDLTFSGVIRCRDGFSGNRLPIRWTIEGESLECYDQATAWDSIRCPKVFGEKAVWADVSGPKEWDAPIQVRLFPNGYQAPKEKEVRVPIGDKTLCFRSKKWLSPAFPMRFDAWIEGGPPDATYLITHMPTVIRKSIPIQSVILNGSTPSEVAWRNIPRTQLTVEIQAVSVASIDLVIEKMRPGMPGSVRKGAIYIDLSGLARVVADLPENVVALAVAGQVKPVIFDKTGATFEPNQAFLAAKQGDSIAAQVFQPIGSPIQATAELNLPDGADYGATPIR